MEMVKLDSWEDYEELPLTKWNIKQPRGSDIRDNAIKTGGLDIVLIPGVAFSRRGGRCGHGRGYYDKFLRRLFDAYPKHQKMLFGLSLQEQIVPEDELPLDGHDYLLDGVITPD